MAEIEIKASSRFQRTSALKVHKIIDSVKNKPVELSLNTLQFMPQKAARLVEKTMRSAVANAENNFDLDVDDLVVRNITADKGPTLKRFRARARGRGTRILKRTAHITVTLAEKSA